MFVIDRDEQQVRLAAEGDMESFEELYHRHKRRVFSICLRMTRNVLDAEDLTQEVFSQLFSKIKTFRGNSTFSSWLYRVTVNQVLMHFRKHSTQMEQITEDGEMPEQMVKDPDQIQMQFTDRIALERAIAQLPPGYRSVFALHDLEGYQHDEIGQMLGYTDGTSKSQLHKARMKLRDLLMKQNKVLVCDREYSQQLAS